MRPERRNQTDRKEPLHTPAQKLGILFFLFANFVNSQKAQKPHRDWKGVTQFHLPPIVS